MASFTAMRRAVAIVAVLVVILSLTGAGLFMTQSEDPGPEAKGLAPRYQRITEDLQAESESLRADAEAASAAGTSDTAQVLKLYGDLVVVTEQARDKYADLAVPANMRGARQRLVNSLETRIEVLDRLMAAVRANDQPAANTAAADLVETARTFGEAQNEILRLIQECGDDCQ